MEEAAGWGHPCAALTPGQPVLGGSPDGLYLAGYTIEHGPVPALTGATTEFESLVTEDGHTFFKLKRGLLLPGFSGSPLLDLRAGWWRGSWRAAGAVSADLGGFAVPAAELAAAFPQVLEANHAFHHGDDRWRTRPRRKRPAPRSGPGAGAGFRCGRRSSPWRRMRTCRRRRSCGPGTRWWAMWAASSCWGSWPPGASRNQRTASRRGCGLSPAGAGSARPGWRWRPAGRRRRGAGPPGCSPPVPAKPGCRRWRSGRAGC